MDTGDFLGGHKLFELTPHRPTKQDFTFAGWQTKQGHMHMYAEVTHSLLSFPRVSSPLVGKGK